MAERSNGKKNTSGTTLDLMGEEEPAPPRAARKAAAPAPVVAAQAAPTEVGGALFGGDEVDLDARHPADVPVGNFPAPSQIAQVDEDAGDPFAEDDPFEDTVMARMLADEPAPLSSPLRAAREEFNLRTDEEAPPLEELPIKDTPAPVMEAVAEPVVEAVAEPNLEAVAEPDLEAFADPVAAPEVEQKIEPETPMPSPSPAPAAKTPAAPKNAAAKTAKTNPPGLTIPRRYTQPGQDVWTTVEWELRTASIVGSDGTVVFEQKGVEIPRAWSQLATNVVVSKYFRGQIGTLEREYSVKQLIGRVSDRILEWGKQGAYFASDADADAFHDELRYILLHQYAAFNSPVWFNLGWAGRRQAVSACYINEVNDTMESILDLYKTEGMLFKDGSGSGLNLSTLRSSKEPLEAGGRSSGPISFMKGLDASAGSIKSGGSCLAPWTRVYTERGPIAVSDLVGKDFITLSYDPPAGRYKAKRAQAWHAGTKRVVRLTTDKGQFDLSYDHPVRLADGRYVPCEQLRPGQSLFHCKVDDQAGYVRVGLRRGCRDSEHHRKLHQLIAEDVLGWDLHGLSLHHRDENKHNNDTANLERLPQTDHARLHGRAQAVQGGHIFQAQKFGKTGVDNPMHANSEFWKDADRVQAYRDRQSAHMPLERARRMHGEAVRVRMLNLAYAVLSEGHSVDTLEDYYRGRLKIGRRCGSKRQFGEDVARNFGSYEGFVQELRQHNHRVVSLKSLGVMDVYDVEVECPTADDKSPQTGHNFVIWPDDSHFGTGIAVANTRRAACMRVLDIDHPDVKEFIDCKKDAEEKAHALIDAGYSGAFNVAGGAYDTVPFQNANHSVRVTDDFMQAVEADAAWDTKFRLSGKSAQTFRARDLMRGIAEGTWVCGDPGMQYDTTINDWHTCANTDRIYASNPCVTGDTLVATSEGWQRIDALVGQSARVIGADGQPHFVDRIFPTGHKPVFKLRTRAGFEVTITGNHQVLTTERGDVAVEDLRLGEHVQLEGAGFGRRALNESLALAIGAAVGDGCLSGQNIRGREQEYVVLTMSQSEAPILEKMAVELNHQKDILRAAGLCGHPGAVSVVPQSTSGTSRLTVGSAPVVEIFKEFAVLDKGSNAKQFTPAAYELDRPTLATVLRGLFTADGTVASYGDKSQSVSLDSTSKDLLRQVQMLLLSFGIKSKLYLRRGGKTEAVLPNSAREPQSYTVQEMHSLRISKASRVVFEREIGFDPASAKSARLRDMNLAFTTCKDTLTDEVVSITEAGAADVYDLTEGITHHFVANGLVVHNCSEYMFLNSTACNLSSLNLMKFRQEGTGAFDTDSFEHAVRLMLTAQEIVVGFASYPTPKIEQRSHEYRTLGLGYANLGALLMAAGLPYDSDAGRAYAGAVTALMTGRAYHQSAAIARDCGGPFSGFAENRDPMLRVMHKHRDQVDQINGALIPDTLLAAARTAWDETISLGESHGYRNAQSTVLAPTGTIGFLMDCDTTGIEPDIAIVKYKSLVGGGMMKIVNQTVPEALERLGYDEAQAEGIIKFIDEHDTIEGAPDLKPEHLPIFDCAFRPMNGTRSIHYRGHIKMMAAAQPFISGAISKTVNVPNDATPEDIAETYLESWKLGIKAVAIYRDGSKRTQPLNTSKEAPAKEKIAPATEAAVPAAPLAPPKAVRRRLPDERAGVTHKFSIGGHEGYLTVGLYPDTNQPGEIFIRMSKEGSSISGLMDSFATAISLALQYGVPLSTLVDKFIHSRFEPSGFTGNKEIPMAKSVMDYIFRYLALRFLQKEDRHNVGLLADQDDSAYAAPAKLPAPPPPPAHDAKSGSLSSGKNGNGGSPKSGSGDLAHLAESNTAAITDHEREIYRMQSDAPPCPECGAITIRSGACYKCLSCGTSLGCS